MRLKPGCKATKYCTSANISRYTHRIMGYINSLCSKFVFLKYMFYPINCIPGNFFTECFKNRLVFFSRPALFGY